jgi:hypothetical protein
MGAGRAAAFALCVWLTLLVGIVTEDGLAM